MSPRGVGAAGFGMLLAACAAGSPGVPHLADDSISEAGSEDFSGADYGDDASVSPADKKDISKV